jgi:hypothetical protein
VRVTDAGWFLAEDDAANEQVAGSQSLRFMTSMHSLRGGRVLNGFGAPTPLSAAALGLPR